MWYKRLLAVYRPQHLISRERERERERERQAPRGPSGLVTDANFHPLPWRLSGSRKDPTCTLFRKLLTTFSTCSQVKRKSD